MTAVFYSADDCAKIAPFIPKELLKDWEWWYKPGNHNDLFYHAQIRRGKFISPYTGFRGNFPMTIPALDAQIVRDVLRGCKNFRTGLDGDIFISDTGGRLLMECGCYMNRESILTDMLYLIDNKLIKEAV
jgi:hypothetical protein